MTVCCFFNRSIVVLISIATVNHSNGFGDDLIPSTLISVVSIELSDCDLKPLMILTSKPDFRGLFLVFMSSALEPARLKDFRVVVVEDYRSNDDCFHTIKSLLSQIIFLPASAKFCLLLSEP
jgi:hypothetical protein